MAIHKVVFELQEPDGSTFNEVYYVDAGNPVAAMPGDLLISARLGLLAPLNKFMRVRTSDISQLRVTGVQVINQNGTWASTDVALNAPVVAGLAVVCQLRGQAGGQRKLWLRGVADAAVNRSSTTGQDVPKAPLLDALAFFSEKLKANLYGILRITPASRVAGPAFPKRITVIAPGAGAGTSILTTESPHLITPNQMVVIGGASKKDTPGLSGRWITLDGTAGSTIVIRYQCPDNLGPAHPTGVVRQFTYQPISQFTGDAQIFDHFGTRTTKDPTTRTRGARRAQRLRNVL
jgi:hypothetical protein